MSQPEISTHNGCSNNPQHPSSQYNSNSNANPWPSHKVFKLISLENKN